MHSGNSSSQYDCYLVTSSVSLTSKFLKRLRSSGSGSYIYCLWTQEKGNYHKPIEVEAQALLDFTLFGQIVCDQRI